MESYKDYPLSRDTSEESEKILFDLLRKRSPAEKFHMISDMVAAGRTLAMSGLRARHPHDTDDQLKVRFVELFYGEEAARQFFERLATIRSDV